MATIQSTLSLQDKMSGVLNKITKSMSGMKAQMEGTAGNFKSIEQGSTGASSSITGMNNSIVNAERNMAIAAAQAENYRAKMDAIEGSMDRNEAAISAMSQQQDIAFSAKRAAQIEKLITAQDKLNNQYQQAALGIQTANSRYQTQSDKVMQLNQKLEETEGNTKKVQKAAEKSPFTKWQAKIITINQALMLTRRIFNMIKRSVSSVLEETKGWDGVMADVVS